MKHLPEYHEFLNSLYIDKAFEAKLTDEEIDEGIKDWFRSKLDKLKGKKEDMLDTIDFMKKKAGFKDFEPRLANTGSETERKNNRLTARVEAIQSALDASRRAMGRELNLDVEWDGPITPDFNNRRKRVKVEGAEMDPEAKEFLWFMVDRAKASNGGTASAPAASSGGKGIRKAAPKVEEPEEESSEETSEVDPNESYTGIVFMVPDMKQAWKDGENAYSVGVLVGFLNKEQSQPVIQDGEYIDGVVKGSDAKDLMSNLQKWVIDATQKLVKNAQDL